MRAAILGAVAVIVLLFIAGAFIPIPVYF